MQFPTYKYETRKHLEGFLSLAGCDEVGVAPLAGPVVAASVILDPKFIHGRRSKNKWWYRVRDSKTTNEKERAELVKFIEDYSLAFAVGEVSAAEIDEINIHQAGLLAMKKSIENLRIKPDLVFLDGMHRIKNLKVPQETVIGGDAKILSVAAASIVAKVHRDKVLAGFHELYPMFGFVKHKGYPTKMHHEAIRKFGISPVHRRSFGFVQEYLRGH